MAKAQLWGKVVWLNDIEDTSTIKGQEQEEKPVAETNKKLHCEKQN